MILHVAPKTMVKFLVMAENSLGYMKGYSYFQIIFIQIYEYYTFSFYCYLHSFIVNFYHLSMKIKNILIILDFFSVWVYNGSTKQREVKLMNDFVNAVTDLLKEFHIMRYVKIKPVTDMEYVTLVFETVDYFDVITFGKNDLESVNEYFIRHILSIWHDMMVKAF